MDNERRMGKGVALFLTIVSVVMTFMVALTVRNVWKRRASATASRAASRAPTGTMARQRVDAASSSDIAPHPASPTTVAQSPTAVPAETAQAASDATATATQNADPASSATTQPVAARETPQAPADMSFAVEETADAAPQASASAASADSGVQTPAADSGTTQTLACSMGSERFPDSCATVSAVGVDFVAPAEGRIPGWNCENGDLRIDFHTSPPSFDGCRCRYCEIPQRRQ